MNIVVRPCGVDARLVEFDVPAEHRRAVRAWLAETVVGDEGAGVVDIVPAASTVLVRYADERSCRAATPQLERLADLSVEDVIHTQEESESGDDLRIPVRYDGEDLAEVASRLGIPVEEVLARHQAARWVVEFTGFTAGFGYLSQVGEIQELTVPRRETPRTSIPAGAVGLADAFAGVYPKASPGGWQIIGTTDMAIFDQDREPPALLTPGTRVRFVDVAGDELSNELGASSSAGQTTSAPGQKDGATSSASAILTVERVGAQALIEDAGRTGSLGTGLASSGACDRSAYRLANRVVGNSEDSPAIEVLLGGLTLRARRECVVAVTGAHVPLWRRRSTDGSADGGGRRTAVECIAAVEADTPIVLGPGDVLELGTPRFGLRNYVAIAGGVAARRVAGSASSDPTAGVGPAPLCPGDLIAVGEEWVGPSALAEHRAVGRVHERGPLVLRATWGPRADWFTEQARRCLSTTRYYVGSDGNRVGIRFDGPALERAVTTELPSEAVLRGAVQVPADGRPLMFFADHPTTGGYPVIAVVDDADTDLLAQARPGQEIRFAVRDA